MIDRENATSTPGQRKVRVQPQKTIQRLFRRMLFDKKHTTRITTILILPTSSTKRGGEDNFCMVLQQQYFRTKVQRDSTIVL